MLTPLVALALSSAAGGQPAAAPVDLLVHEWWTFTSMQGSDGVTLEGLHHEEAELPAFVCRTSEVEDDADDSPRAFTSGDEGRNSAAWNRLERF